MVLKSSAVVSLTPPEQIVTAVSKINQSSLQLHQPSALPKTADTHTHTYTQNHTFGHILARATKEEKTCGYSLTGGDRER